MSLLLGSLFKRTVIRLFCSLFVLTKLTFFLSFIFFTALKNDYFMVSIFLKSSHSLCLFLSIYFLTKLDFFVSSESGLNLENSKRRRGKSEYSKQDYLQFLGKFKIVRNRFRFQGQVSLKVLMALDLA